jgi:inner membrane protein
LHYISYDSVRRKTIPANAITKLMLRDSEPRPPQEMPGSFFEVIRLLYKTHLFGGFIAGILLTGSLVCGTVSAAAALLPDLDDPKSFAGSIVMPASLAANVGFGHRRLFHSLLAAALFAGVAFLAQQRFHWPLWVVLAVLVGFVSHLALDTLNPAGVPWLWPLNLHLSIPVVQTGGFLERFVLVPAGCLASLIIAGVQLVPLIEPLLSRAASILHHIIR